jgi:hypothetical protein
MRDRGDQRIAEGAAQALHVPADAQHLFDAVRGIEVGRLEFLEGGAHAAEIIIGPFRIHLVAEHLYGDLGFLDGFLVDATAAYLHFEVIGRGDEFRTLRGLGGAIRLCAVVVGHSAFKAPAAA